MYDDMNGLYSLNGGMPPGVSRPRRRPAMWFDGVDDRVITSAPLPLSGDMAVSLSVWIFGDRLVNPTLYGVLFTSQKPINLSLFGIMIRGTTQIYAQYRGGSVSGLYPLKNYQWHHIVICKSPGAINMTTSIYVDGTPLVVSGTSGTPNFDNTSSPVVGEYFGAYRFPGCIRHCRVYNRVLGASEIEQLAQFQGQKNWTNDGLLVYYVGDGITADNWGGGTVYGSPERCLVHVRGAVIRTDPGTGERYIVR